MDENPLPDPDSAELAALLPSAEHRSIYRLLFRRRDNPPTMSEIEARLRETSGKNHSQRGRRVRELYRNFQIEKTGDRPPRYKLVAIRSDTARVAPSINQRIRAKVLEPGRCARCGRSPLGHGVVLVVDHIIPQRWGGSSDLNNLQPLCTDCNAGKKDNVREHDKYLAEIRVAVAHDEPQRRIGELLTVFGPEVWIPSDVIAAVANAKEYQEDWHKRMRELRLLGWDYTHRKARRGGRVVTDYRLTKSAPWPDNIGEAIRREEAARRATRERNASVKNEH